MELIKTGCDMFSFAVDKNNPFVQNLTFVL